MIRQDLYATRFRVHAREADLDEFGNLSLLLFFCYLSRYLVLDAEHFANRIDRAVFYQLDNFIVVDCALSLL